MIIDKGSLQYLADYIKSNLGIIYSLDNPYQLESRIQNTLQRFKFESAKDLVKAIRDDKDRQTINFFLDVATNNETSFFRDLKVFQQIAESALKPAFQRKSHTPFRIWCAACSSGQEPYSLAILLRELAGNQAKDYFEVHATDISTQALTKAQAAEYSQMEVQRGLSSMYLIKYFDKVTEGSQHPPPVWRVKPEVRELIAFQQHNLLAPWSQINKFDLIMCRNVLIYQDATNREKILQKLHGSLTQDGLLVLGCAETLFGIESAFQPVKGSPILIYRKRTQAGSQAI
jgi:chemotaxis protein methyltransferase CheR